MQLEKGKIGQFFMFIGLILLVIFFTSGRGWGSAFGYFLAGVALVFLGGYIFIQDRPPVDPNSARFRTVRKVREREEKRKEQRQQRKKR